MGKSGRERERAPDGTEVREALGIGIDGLGREVHLIGWRKKRIDL